MTSSVSRRAMALGITLTAAVGLFAGCSATAPGETGRLQTVLASCPEEGKVNSYQAVDGSGSTQSSVVVREYLAYLETQVERVAVCGGHLTVVAFGTNSVTSPIYVGEISVHGATDLARLRRVPAVVDEVVDAIAKNYAPAVALLPQGGTDVTGLFRLFGEAQNLRPEMRLEASALTDGVTNQGVSIDRALSPDEATALADTVAVPKLQGANVSVVGIGRAAGDPLPSDVIAGMKSFYTRLCENTEAVQCLVITDGR